MRFTIAALAALVTFAGWSVQAQELASTPLSPEQKAANFDNADVNKDGKLDKTEFASTPRGQPPADPVVNWKASDVDRDGFVTKVEFMSTLKGVVTQLSLDR
jgi:hypothetical protein